jgi:hypothetical protein
LVVVKTDDEDGVQEQSLVSESIKDGEGDGRSHKSRLPAKVIKSILELVCDESVSIPNIIYHFSINYTGEC